MQRTNYLLIVSILLCVMLAPATHGDRKEGELSPDPKPVPLDVAHIEAYKKYAGESDITETVKFVSRNSVFVSQLLDGSYKRTPEVTVKGALILPQQSEPVPVVVLSPDSGGPSGFYSEWTKPFWKRAISPLLKNGIGIFILDGFTTRGINHTLDDQSRYFGSAQILDTLLAFNTLASDPRIDGQRIAVSGHSRGAITSFAVVDRRLTDAVLGEDHHFVAALPMAADCDYLFQNPKPTLTKTLVLHGSADNYTPAPPCIKHVEKMKAKGADINLILKKGWHHAFYGDYKPQICRTCVYFYKCPTSFVLADDGHLNMKGREFLKTINEDYEKWVATENKGAEAVRIYRKVYRECGSMGPTIGGGHWRESAKIFSSFFIDALLP